MRNHDPNCVGCPTCRPAEFSRMSDEEYCGRHLAAVERSWRLHFAALLGITLPEPALRVAEDRPPDPYTLAIEKRRIEDAKSSAPRPTIYDKDGVPEPYTTAINRMKEQR